MTRMISAVDLFSRPVAKALNLLETTLPHLPPDEIYLGQAVREFHEAHNLPLHMPKFFKTVDQSLGHTMAFHVFLKEEGVSPWNELVSNVNGSAVYKAMHNELPVNPSIDQVLADGPNTGMDEMRMLRLKLKEHMGFFYGLKNPDEPEVQSWVDRAVRTLKSLEDKGYPVPKALQGNAFYQMPQGPIAPANQLVAQWAQQPIPRLREYA